jgi:hypothetical protein
VIKTAVEALKQIGHSFKLEPFSSIIEPIIEEVLKEHKKDKYRKGTILTPCIMTWLVLSLTLRRDLNYNKTLNWMISGFRLKFLNFPKNLVKNGAISHARVKLGVDVFRDMFYKLVAGFKTIEPDFKGLVTAMFDGTSMTMPDTESNREKYGKHKAGRGYGAFPQMRAVALMVMSARRIFDIAYAPCKGKKTGEKTLMFEILKKCKWKSFLFLFDAGFYSFFLAYFMQENGLNFIMKVAKSVKLKAIRDSHMPDGSYLSVVKRKIVESVNPATGRKKWKEVEIVVRVIEFTIPGFRPVRLITSLLDPAITAKEIVIHYHKRWDIEIAYDEIKTHQCATLKGQMPTILRSKRADLVEQELYAVLITYNMIRSLMKEATNKEGGNPLFISFLDTMQTIIECAPHMSAEKLSKRKKHFDYLLKMIAESKIDRPRRPRSNPRVVKVKMSNFKRKRKKDKSEYRNFERDIEIIPYQKAA